MDCSSNIQDLRNEFRSMNTEEIYSNTSEVNEAIKERSEQLFLTLMEKPAGTVSTVCTLGLYRKFQEKRAKKQKKQIDYRFNLWKSSSKKKESYKHRKISKVLKKRLPKSADELKRLQKNPRIKQAFKDISKEINQQIVKRSLTTRKKIAIGHSLEFQEALEKTHYCINHGQNLGLEIFNVVITLFKRHFEPNCWDHYRWLRHPSGFEFADRDIDRIKRSKEIDVLIRNDVICGDVFLKNVIFGESAIDFLTTPNMSSLLSRFIKSVLKSITKQYFFTKKARSRFVRGCLKAAKELPRGGGNLYTIAIPKKDFEKTCYLSKPRGVPVREKYTEEHLEKMQKGIDPRQKNSGIPATKYAGGNQAPQVRVFAPMLIPNPDLAPDDRVYILRSSTASDKVLQNLESKVEEVFNKVINLEKSA